MAFREAILAKPFDLIEAALREHRIIAAGRHAGDHFFFVILDCADLSERRHGSAQTIGFFGGKLGGIN